jgi:TolA-binding protein
MAQFKKIELTLNGVLTPKAIKAYLEQKLSDEQMAEMKTLLESDPFSKDAVDGYKSESNIDAAIALAADTRQKIKESTGAGKPSISMIQIDWALLAYAAAFIGLVVGIGFIFIMYKDKASNEQLAIVQLGDTLISGKTEEVQNTAIAEIEVLPDSTSDSTNQITASTDPQRGVAGEISSIKPAAEEKKSPQPMALTTAKAAEQKMVESGQKIVADIKEGKASNVKEVAAAAPIAAQGNAEDADEAEKLRAEKKAKESAAKFEKAMKLFNSGEYRNAGTMFDDVVNVSPDNSEATYFSGVCNYINGNKPKAEQRFDKLIKKGSYTEGSKWYKANILLGKGNKDEAVKILKQLTGSTSVFKDRAIKKLEEIESE